MPSIKSIFISLAVAAVVSAQAGTQIVDGQIQVPTAAPSIVTVISRTPTPTAPTVTVRTSAGPLPTTNGTVTTGAPAKTPTAFPGAANMMVWSKEIAVGAVGVAVGLAFL